MPGSMADFDYISDDGVTYGLRMDEGNAVAAGNTPLSSALTPKLPQGYEPRYVNVKHPASGASRRVVVGDPANALWAGSVSSVSLLDYTASPIAAANFLVQSWIGEKRTRRLHVADTGLLTG